ncbi:hypothetical protein M3667_07240 [Microbacterium sp. P26]|uniref:hypothetical protein n=1 Tax=Microbacterium TaxID=33882 RepID=UPI00203C7C55|nr:hypothetical protein [Microbacterium sp. P26]MCM3501673.1 hypothetical protein [Microbacterium sp. P26]
MSDEASLGRRARDRLRARADLWARIRPLLICCGLAAWVGGITLGYFSDGPWRVASFVIHLIGLAVFFGAFMGSAPVIPP